MHKRQQSKFIRQVNARQLLQQLAEMRQWERKTTLKVLWSELKYNCCLPALELNVYFLIDDAQLVIIECVCPGCWVASAITSLSQM